MPPSTQATTILWHRPNGAGDPGRVQVLLTYARPPLSLAVGSPSVKLEGASVRGELGPTDRLPYLVYVVALSGGCHRGT